MSFKKVRDAHKTENTEDYLEIIAELLNNNGEARIVDIANKLDTFGYLTALKRTRVGDYLINDSLSIDGFQDEWKSINH